jgi:hypothetical protein
LNNQIIVSEQGCMVYLTQGKIAWIDQEDVDKISLLKWRAEKSGYTYYAKAEVEISKYPRKRKIFRMHRVICSNWNSIDHINRNGLDNRKSNLREADKKQNGRNRPAQKMSTSKYKGVSWVPRLQKWLSQITVDGKNTYLGIFNDEVLAAKAYDAAANLYFGEFAWTNFPKRG